MGKELIHNHPKICNSVQI